MDERLKNYAHAMEIDSSSNKPMQKVAAQLTGSNVIQPVDVQTRYSQTVMTHNAVSVGASASTTRVEVDTKGYSKAIIMHSSNPGNAQVYVNPVSSNGTVITGKSLGTTSNFVNGAEILDLNGLEKISVYGKDTSGASNAITIEVSLMA